MLRRWLLMTVLSTVSVIVAVVVDGNVGQVDLIFHREEAPVSYCNKYTYWWMEFKLNNNNNNCHQFIMYSPSRRSTAAAPAFYQGGPSPYGIPGATGASANPFGPAGYPSAGHGFSTKIFTTNSGPYRPQTTGGSYSTVTGELGKALKCETIDSLLITIPLRHIASFDLTKWTQVMLY